MVIFEELFKTTRGKTIEYNGQPLQLYDEFPLPKNTTSIIKIVFEETNSKWRQGISLTSDQPFSIEKKIIGKKIILWEDTAPNEVILRCQTREGYIVLHNSWDTGDGITQSWHAGAAMKVEQLNHSRRYYCNDGHLDDDLNDLIFRVEILEI